MRKLILENYQSPGDLLMLTAAIRDLHQTYPNEFQTDLRTACPDLWQNNPYVSSLREGDAGVTKFTCHYPLIHQCNTAPFHFIHGFYQFLNQELDLRISPQRFHGDVHLSESEKEYPDQIARPLRGKVPYWIIDAGGKYDFTIKWWSSERYQAVVDHFIGKLVFVQVGEFGHHHPPLKNVVDLRGKTNVRQLIQLMHFAEGVVCPVTFLMHLAAAVPHHNPRTQTRPCVVIAGGREPTHWEAYSHHQFIHTIGALWCCKDGGCWRSRTVPLGDGSDKDKSTHLCMDVKNGLPRCMEMITSDEVIRRIEIYLDGGAAGILKTPDAARVRSTIQRQNRKTAKPSTRSRVQVLASAPKVVHFLPCGQLGGLERCVLNLCKHDREQNVGVVLKEEGPIQRLFARHKIPVVALWKARDSTKVQARLRSLVAQADIINCHCVTDFGPAYRFRQLFDMAHMISLQWYCQAPLTRSLLICASPSVAAIQAKENHVRTILNGIDENEFSAKQPRDYSGELIHVVRVCRPEKCSPYFWDVAERILRSHRNVRLTVVGEAGRSTDQIRYVGPKADIRKYLEAAHIFLYTPHEKVGAHDLSVLEAMSMGAVPVVANEVCVRDSIEDGVDGYLLPRNDVDIFDRTISKLIDDRHQLEAMSRACAKSVRSKFTMDRMSAEYSKAYTDELSGRRTRR